MAGQDPLDPHTKNVAVPDYVAALSGDIRGVRLGVPNNYFSEDVQPEVADAPALSHGSVGRCATSTPKPLA